MNKNTNTIIFILLVVIGVLIYGKVTTKPTIIYRESKQTTTETSQPSQEIKKVNRECLLSAEKFFEQKRAENIDLYSATWNEHYDEITGNCYIQIQGNIYDVKTGELITTRQTIR